MIWVATEDFSPSQIGIPSTRMSAAITRSKISGQSSRSQPCSVMSGQTPVAIVVVDRADAVDLRRRCGA